MKPPFTYFGGKTRIADRIAALLPAHPPAGMKVIVAGRPNPPIPDDVPDGHPLRDPDIVRLLGDSGNVSPELASPSVAVAANTLPKCACAARAAPMYRRSICDTHFAARRSSGRNRH